MARPSKNNADYFSHDNNMRDDMRVKALRSKFGLEGYAIFCMLLEIITDSDGFRLRVSELDLEIISGDFGIDSQKLKTIIEYLKILNLIQQENEYIFSIKLSERLSPVIQKREFLKQKYTKMKVSTAETSISVPVMQQSKVKESKVKESKEKKYKENILFEDFWKEYPRKENKKKSLLIFSKLKEDIQLKIIEDVKQRKEKHQTWLRGFIPHATTYLNGERWNDAIETSEIKPDTVQIKTYNSIS